MTIDLGGPASAANSVTVRPADARTFGPVDTWFKDCSSSTAQDGTAIGASQLNQPLAWLRRLIRGAGITPDNTNDDMVLQAVQSMRAAYAVDSGGVNALVVDVNTPGFSLAAGTSVKVKVGNTVTGPATIDIKNLTIDLGTYNITRGDLSALNPFDMVQNRIVGLIFDGTQFQLPYNIDGGTGDVKLTLKTSADPGWVMMNDGTLGSASSSATILASAACLKLYTLLWSNISNTFAPVAGGRGASAAADFAANKPIQLLAAAGRALALAGSGAGLTSRALGQNLGEELHQLITAELASHGHGISDPGHGHSVNDPTHKHTIGDPAHTHSLNNATVSGTGSGGGGTGPNGVPTTVSVNAAVTGIDIAFASTGITVNGATTGISVSNAGSGTAHNNMQPSIFMNAMVRL